jgi:hypothetical protein
MPTGETLHPLIKLQQARKAARESHFRQKISFRIGYATLGEKPIQRKQHCGTGVYMARHNQTCSV